LCLDEIFFHREPILMAVEPVSLAWLAGQRGPDRTGASGCKVIEKWPSLEHVVADGGTGLEKGVKLAVMSQTWRWAEIHVTLGLV
jgi:hypothetical protein